MNTTASEWFMLTPAGVLHAFAHKEPDDTALACQQNLQGQRGVVRQASARSMPPPGPKSPNQPP